MTRKPKNKITFELLRKDAVRAATLVDTAANGEFEQGNIDRNTLSMLRHLALMLNGATHIVIHDADELPDD
jgi:hypothetical protein